MTIDTLSPPSVVKVPAVEDHLVKVFVAKVLIVEVSKVDVLVVQIIGHIQREKKLLQEILLAANNQKGKALDKEKHKHSLSLSLSHTHMLTHTHAHILIHTTNKGACNCL